MIINGLQFERFQMFYGVVFSTSTVLNGKDKPVMLCVWYDFVKHKSYLNYQQN